MSEDKYSELRRLAKQYGLVGASEVCDIVGVHSGHLPPLRRRDAAFPEPLEQLASGPVWIRAEVTAYARKRNARKAAAAAAREESVTCNG